MKHLNTLRPTIFLASSRLSTFLPLPDLSHDNLLYSARKLTCRGSSISCRNGAIISTPCEKTLFSPNESLSSRKKSMAWGVICVAIFKDRVSFPVTFILEALYRRNSTKVITFRPDCQMTRLGEPRNSIARRLEFIGRLSRFA